MKINKKIIIDILIVIIYFFRQAIYYINPENGYFIVGNFDVLYLLAILYIIKNTKKINKKIIIGISILIVYAFLQIVIIDNINSLKVFINIAKVILCYFVFLYSKENIKNVNLNNVCKIFSILCLIFLIISFMFPSSILWRHNDTINKYDLERLQFLYTEPGELGMHCALILLILISSILKEEKVKEKLKLVIYLLPILATIFFTKSLGAIGVGTIAVLALFVYDWIKNNTFKKNIIYSTILVIAILMVIILMATSNSMYLRLIDTFNGKDSSNNYRITIPFNVMKQMLIDTHGQGVGFGNAELENNVQKYSHLKLEGAGIINSFFNFIAEGGILAILIVASLIYTLIRSTLKNTNIETIEIVPLVVFIILYQFMGTYFTNPLCWIVYGIIINSREKQVEDKCEKKVKE